MRLDELSQGWGLLEATIEENGGELTFDIARRFDLLSMEERQKVDRVIFVLKGLKGDAERLKQLEDELAVKRKTRERNHEQLLGMVKWYMMGRGTDELQGEVWKFKLVSSGKRPVEVIAPVESLPPEWVKVTKTPVLEAIRLALELDPGNLETLSSLARLGEPTTSIRIY